MKAIRLILVALSILLFPLWSNSSEPVAPGSGLAAVAHSQCQDEIACDAGHAAGQDSCQIANCAGCAVVAVASCVSGPIAPSIIHAAIPVQLEGLAIAPEKEPPRFFA